jgi:hypothetical protein
VPRWQVIGERIAYLAAALFLAITGEWLFIVFAGLLAFGGFLVTSRFPRFGRRVFGYPVRKGEPPPFAAAEFAFGTTLVGIATATAIIGAVT